MPLAALGLSGRVDGTDVGFSVNSTTASVLR